jgi:hypothetical protein
MFLRQGGQQAAFLGNGSASCDAATSSQPQQQQQPAASSASDSLPAASSVEAPPSQQLTGSSEAAGGLPDLSGASSGMGATAAPAAAMATAAADLSDDPIMFWDSWCQHFEEQDVAGSRMDTLTWRLAAALAEEDYAAAAAIKPELEELAAGDSAAVVQTQLAAALDEEDYAVAAALRDTAAAGLMGWWCCASEGDPAGHLLHISPEYVALCYVVMSMTPVMNSIIGWLWQGP